MAVIVMGGSNSIFRDGWISRLPADLPLVNLSVGASTSICGLYRALLPDGPGPGDTIVWEYALNESVHVRQGYALANVLKNVAHLLAIAADRGCRFVPLIFMPRGDEQQPECPDYYARLIELFRQHGLQPVDISASLRDELGVERIPDEYFSDGMHYARSDLVMDHIGRRATEALDLARVPERPVSGLTCGRTVRLLPLDQPDRFENSIMSVPVVAPPLRVRLQEAGSVLSVVCICRPNGNFGLRARIMRRGKPVADGRFSVSSRKDMTLLKPIAFENLGNWKFQPGDALVIRPASRPGRYYAEQGLRRRLSGLDNAAHPSVAGILVEVGDGRLT